MSSLYPKISLLAFRTVPLLDCYLYWVFITHSFWHGFSFLLLSWVPSKQGLLVSLFFFFFFLPWESPSASGLQPSFLFFFSVNDWPTDPQPHQVPHFFLFSDGDTLCQPSQLKRINTQVSISSQGLSSLTDRTLLNCTNSVESTLFRLPEAFFFFLYHTYSVGRFCCCFLCIILERSAPSSQRSRQTPELEFLVFD